MFFMMLFIIVFYMAVVSYFAKKYSESTESDLEKILSQTEKTYELIESKKDISFKKKHELEEESLKIFALYEISKEIAVSLNESDAFEIFKIKIKEYLSFSECYFFPPGAEDLKEYKKTEDYFIFGLQGRKRKLGNIVIKGISEKEKEKLLILCHQFALALGRVLLYQELEETAITDGLTKVHTRRYALDRCQEELRRSKSKRKKMSFLMIDLDFFKKYNDKYGHLTGDQILAEVSNIIKNNIREIDIPGRYGGEEFCVILPDTDRSGALYVSERIRQAAEKASIKAYDATVKVTLSIGTATYPDDAKVLSELVDKSDWALYRAKKLGRNKICSFGVYKK